MTDLLSDEDIWGPAPQDGGALLSDADIWGPSTKPERVKDWKQPSNDKFRKPPEAITKDEKGRDIEWYSADNPPYDENAFVAERKKVNGKDYFRHSETGEIYDASTNRITGDPEILKAFGKEKPTKVAQGRLNAQDQSSLWGDLQAGWHNLRSGVEAGKAVVADQDMLDADKPLPKGGRAAGFQHPDPLVRESMARRRRDEALVTMSEQGGKAAAIPQAPAAQAFDNAATFGDAWSAFWSDPLTVSRSTVARSAPASMPSVVGGIIGSVLGPAGAAAGAGAGSYATELGGAIQDGLVENGADLNNPESVIAVWRAKGPEIMSKARTRSAIIGLADAAGGAASAKIVQNVADGFWTKAGKIAAGTGVQMGAGGGGEAGAQLATEGRITSPGAILGEIVGEGAMGAGEAAGQMVVGGGQTATPQPAPVPPGAPVEPRIFPDVPPQAAQPGPEQAPPIAPELSGNRAEIAPELGGAAQFDPEADILAQSGWTPEQIVDMNPAERQGAVAEAVQAGIRPRAPSPENSAPIVGEPQAEAQPIENAPMSQGQAPDVTSSAPAENSALSDADVGLEPAPLPRDFVPDRPALTVPPRELPPREAPLAPIPPDLTGKMKDYINNTRRPLNEKAVAKTLGVDEQMAGRLLQQVVMGGGARQTRSGRYARKPTYQSPPSLARFVADAGGIVDTGGELRAADLHRSKGALRGIVHPDGLPINDVLEMALEEGYLQDAGWGTGLQRQLSDADFIQALIDDYNAPPERKIYRLEDQAWAEEMRVKQQNAAMDPDWQPTDPITSNYGVDAQAGLMAAIEESGIPQEQWAPAVLQDAARLISEGMAPDVALEQATIYFDADAVANAESLWPEIDAMWQARQAAAVTIFDPPPFPTEVYDEVDRGPAPQEIESLQPVGEVDQEPGGPAEGPAVVSNVQGTEQLGEEAQPAAGEKIDAKLSRNARNASNSRVSDVVRREAKVPEPQSQSLQILRRSRDNDLPGVEGQFSSVFNGRGETPGERADIGQGGQQQRVRAGEYPVDGLGDAEQQQADQQIRDARRSADDRAASNTNSRVDKKSSEQPDFQRASARKSAGTKTAKDGETQNADSQRSNAPASGVGSGTESVVQTGSQSSEKRMDTGTGTTAGAAAQLVDNVQGSERKVQRSIADPQLSIPGTDPDIKGATQNAANKPLKAKAPQKDADDGLFGVGAQSPELFDVRQKPLASVARDPDAAFAAQFMQELAAHDELFQNPVSSATSLEQVMAEVVKEAEPLGQFMLSEGEQALGAVSKKRFRDEDGHEFFVFEDGDGQVWLDISDYRTGRGGSAVYAAITNYAHNAGKVFIGDPAGLSDDALRRRTEAMLSSALRFGTTRHIEPHPRQLEGSPETGVAPLKWTYGDDFANIQSLIDASISNLLSVNPDIANARYDFDTRTFRTGEGQPISDGLLKAWGDDPGVRKARAGRQTIRRVILLNTLSRSPSSERPRLLEQALRFSRELVTGGGLKGTLYRISPNPLRFVRTEKQVRELQVKIQDAARRMLGHDLANDVLLVTDPDYQQQMADAGMDAEFDPNTGLIAIALGATQNPESLFRHEIIHKLRNMGVFTKAEWAALRRLAEQRWIDQYDIRSRYEKMYGESFDITPEQLQDLLVEEAIADAMSDNWQDVRDPDSIIGRITQKLRRFLEAIASLARGQGFVSAEQVMADVESGKVGERTPNTGEGRGFRLDAKQASQEAPLASVPPDDGGVGMQLRMEGLEGEAAADLRQFAGNINLNNIDATEDIKTILKETSDKADGFMKARRGVVSHDQTKQLAEELGMSVNQLLKRKRGQAFNAHEIYAARAMMLKSAELVKQAAARAKNTTSDVERAYFMRVLTRHAAIQEQVAGMAAEAGRALNQFRMLVGADYIGGVTEILSEKSYGGKMGNEAIKDLAEMVDSLDSTARIGKMSRALYKPGFLDMIREYYINSLLSGPTTQAVNLISNLLVAVNQIPETWVAEQIGKFHGGPKVERGEAIARAIGLLEGSREGLQLAGKTLWTGVPQTPESQFDQPVQKAIPGLVGEVVRAPSRLMMTTDEFFKAVNYRAELNALAVRAARSENLTGQAFAERVVELRDNPTPQMVKQAIANAKYQTFQNKLGPKGQTLMRFRESWHLWWLLPFLRTPINILKFAAERSPLGPFLMRSVRDNLTGKNGAEARDTQIARMVLGTVAITGMAALAMAGLATGGGSDDEREKGAMRADGWQPYSIKWNGKYYNYLRFDPFSLHMGIVADMKELIDKMEEGEPEKLGGMLLASIINNITDKTWLKSATEFSRMTDDPKRYMENYLSRLGTGFIPNLSAQLARFNDPVFRDARTLMDRIKERIPGPYGRESLQPRYDIFGEVIKGEGNLGPDLLSSVYVSTQKNNPIAKAMVEADFFPSLPTRKINGHDLTSEQYAEYSKLAGQRAVKILTRFVTAENWSKRPQDMREKILKDGYDDARDYARDVMKSKFPELRKKAEAQ